MPLDQAVLAARDREAPAPHRLHLAVAHAGQVGAHDIGGGLEHPFLVCEVFASKRCAPWPTALGIDRDRRVHAADLDPRSAATASINLASPPVSMKCGRLGLHVDPGMKMEEMGVDRRGRFSGAGIDARGRYERSSRSARRGLAGRRSK
jgi:hypothetical protein